MPLSPDHHEHQGINASTLPLIIIEGMFLGQGEQVWPDRRVHKVMLLALSYASTRPLSSHEVDKIP